MITNILKSILTLIFLMTLIGQIKGQSFPLTYSPSNMTVDIDHCSGVMTIEFVIYIDDDGEKEDETWLNGSNIKMKIGSGSQVNILEMGFGKKTSGGYRNLEIPERESDVVHYKFLRTDMNMRQIGVSHTDPDEFPDDNRPSRLKFAMDLKESWIGQSINITTTQTFETGGTYPNINKQFTRNPDLQGFMATENDFCDKVDLSWTVPGNLCSTAMVEIYRDDQLLKRVAAAGGRYSDLTAIKSTDHSYKARFVSQMNRSGEYNRGGFSNTVVGSLISALNPPTALTATTSNCNDEIVLNWQWNNATTDLQYFRIERRLKNTGSWQILTSTLDPDKRSYRDTPPQYDQEYEYRIYSRNDCSPSDLSQSSSIVTGLMPGLPPAPAHISSTATTSSVTINWSSAGQNTTGFIIERSVVGGGSPLLIDGISKNATSYTDRDIEQCLTYTYKVQAVSTCYPDGYGSNTTSIQIAPDLSGAFATDGSGFSASKGYFTDKIELTWTNNNDQQTNRVRIYRRVLGAGLPFSLLASENDDSGIYNDNDAEAGIIYEYEIQAEGPCENATVLSNRVSAIGFRSKQGQVNGNVSYTGGIAVKDAKIIAERDEVVVGKSLNINKGELIIENNSNHHINNELLIETWVKPTSLEGDFAFVLKSLEYALYKSSSNIAAYVYSAGGHRIAISVPDTILPINQWTHLATQLRNDSLHLYVNGEVISSRATNTTTYRSDRAVPLYLGKGYQSPGFDGHMKEVRIWNTSLSDQEIKQNYNIHASGRKPGMIAYIPMDEGIGEYAYDRSQTGPAQFNRNHAKMSAEVMWSDDTPSDDQLSYAAYTDEKGNYTLRLPYTNAGETYELTPVYKTHQFNPSSRILFVGDASSVINGIDFEDISSFRVTGSIFYDNMTCASEGVFIKVDGQVVVEQGEPVRSDVNGSFEIQVPIGEHVITIEKNGHEFSEGRFPETGVFDFQEPITGIEFRDKTLRKVVGRVVGGLREAQKKPGLGRSVNNIGRARLTFDPTATCGWITDTVLLTTRLDTTIYTDPVTGEYILELPPMNYTVTDAEVISNPAIDFGANRMIDLTRLNTSMYVSDTVRRDGTGEIIRIDSTSYHKQHDYIYRSNPSLDVQNTSGTKTFTGDKEYIYEHTKFGSDTIDLEMNPLTFPVFTQNRTYRALISTFEEYENKDGGTVQKERVPITEGKLTIQNNLAVDKGVVIDLNNAESYNGDTLYVFSAGEPNINVNTSVPDYSFTKTFEIELKTGDKSVSWLPHINSHPTGGNGFYRGYVMGIEAVDGADFVTQGPQLVDYILRDPPGSQSFATRLQNTTTIEDESWDWNVGAGLNTSLAVLAGVRFSTGLGYISPTNIVSTTQLGLSTTFSGGEGKSIIVTTTLEEDWSTSDDPLFAGAESDLFLGRSYNYFMAIANSLVLVPASMCTTGAVQCSGTSMNGFRFATEKNLTLAESDVETQFVYTQAHIENNEIPQLEELRNLHLANDPRYTSYLAIDHACFGYNNDDPRLGTSVCPNTIMGTIDPMATTVDDYTGPSYTFNAPISNIDTVRIYNQQIRLWKEALAQNEKEKLETNEFIANYSYSGGGASLTRTTVNSRAKETRKQFEFLFEESLSQKFGSDISGVGIEDAFSIGLTQNRKRYSSDLTENSTTVSFTVKDNSEFDDFTFDVYEGSTTGGPIFKTLGGRSSCPHEGKVVSKYYSPGAILSPGTIQLEKPEITISPSILYNVPQSEPGIFKMTLNNNNPVQGTWEYATQLIKNTNPNSANVNVGFSDEITGNYVIPGGSSLSRDLFVEIGNGYDYDSLLIVMHSMCQYTQGLSAQKDIADSAYISIHFIPECTNISLANPQDQWVLNNSFNDTLDIIAKDYNINHLNFKSLQLEYKPNNQADWIRLDKFYKDTSGIIEVSPKPLNLFEPITVHQWDVSQIPDGPYDLRATTDCGIVTRSSPIYSGYMDRVNPHPFGTPSPADGILDPDDDILLKLNEPLDIGSVNNLNFDVRGVLNGSEMRHETSLGFDGVDDYAEIVPYQLQKRSLTVEGWVKRNGNGAKAIFSQSAESRDQLFLGFDTGDKVRFRLGDIEMTSTASISDDQWHHIAVSYDRTNADGQIYIDFALDATDNNFDTDYTGSGVLLIGRDATGEVEPFTGFIHGLRLWNKARDVADIAAKGNKLLSGREGGLVGCWDLDEGHGLGSNEKVRGRHASIHGATWSILPQNHAYHLDGVDDLLLAQAGSLGFDEETDLTLEAWFKTSASTAQTILSNGKADGSQTADAWEVYIDPSGVITVENNGVMIKSPPGWNDGSWHHVAVVVERTKATSLYVNGDLLATTNSNEFQNFVGSTVVVGATMSTIGTSVNIEKYFNGQVDDIRIWNTARQSDQIKRDRLYQLVGDELGLQAYYPFDGVTEQLGVMLRTPTLRDESVNDYDLQLYNTTTEQYVLDAPPIKLPRLIEKVNFTYSLNNDEIYIALNDLPARIENTIIDITVRGFRDEAGNFMQSPRTWTAFIDKNQVFWENEYFAHEMKTGDTYSFTSKIINTGGRQERYAITNLPPWLSASSTSGFIEPNSSVEITFTLDPFINIGAYEQDVYVSTESFGFNERLLFDLKVSADPPDWSVDPEAYTAAMSYIGEIFIDDIISTDAEDIIVAMIRDTIRGVGHVSYSPGTGKHLVYLDIYGHGVGESNSSDGDTIVFQLWDASEDKIYSKVTPLNEIFIEGELRGSLSNPVAFKSSDQEEIIYNLKRGWNWISFPVFSNQLKDVDQLFREVGFAAFDRITNHKETIFQSTNGTWKGEPGMLKDGMNLKDGYRLYTSVADTFSYNGKYPDPKYYKIPLSAGWSSIGMIAEDPIDVTTALANLEPQDGDWIKSQRGFAVYEDGFGWNGSLRVLSPQSSYMIKMAAKDTLIYPNIRGLKSGRNKNAINQDVLYTTYEVIPEMYDYSMSMVVTIEGQQEWDSKTEWHVAAYKGATCQGVNEISMDDRRKTRIAYLNVYGSIDDELTFKLISSDGDKSIALKETYKLSPDGTLGLPSTPEILSVGYPCRSEILVGTNYKSFIDDANVISATNLIRLDSPPDNMSSLRIKAGEAIEVISGFESAFGNQLELHIEPCKR